jgi:hypothetical protein
MIPNHTRFIEAIKEKRKVRLRFYSRADSGVLDLVCAAMDYGPGGEIEDGLHRYSLWNYASNTEIPKFKVDEFLHSSGLCTDEHNLYYRQL